MSTEQWEDNPLSNKDAVLAPPQSQPVPLTPAGQPDLDNQLTQKEAALKALLTDYDSVAVALSGGVDSTLLLSVAQEVLGTRALALTASMVSLPKREWLAAEAFCRERDICHIKVPFDEFAVNGFANNPPNRCYLCKKALLAALIAAAREQGTAVLIEGSNLDDENDYRPGNAALAEHGVVSPLKLAGFTKDDIRALSKARNLPTWNKPACACLATRLPYGTQISPELLERIDAAEQLVLDAGALQARVRVHDNGNLARIEVDAESVPLFLHTELSRQIDEALKELGFTYVTLDLLGYQMGSMNGKHKAAD